MVVQKHAGCELLRFLCRYAVGTLQRKQKAFKIGGDRQREGRLDAPEALDTLDARIPTTQLLRKKLTPVGHVLTDRQPGILDVYRTWATPGF